MLTFQPQSPRLSQKSRKTKRAPERPITSTPNTIGSTTLSFGGFGDGMDSMLSLNENELKKKSLEMELSEYEREKIVKNNENRNRQSRGTIEDMDDYSCSYSTPDKSTFGKWKRKKGPAPSRPIPQRRSVKQLPIVEVRRELDLIELQQQGLEKQGVRLEQIIRERCEGPNSESQVPIEVEDLILQLFEVVNEKNELCRRQAELMYL